MSLRKFGKQKSHTLLGYNLFYLDFCDTIICLNILGRKTFAKARRPVFLAVIVLIDTVLKLRVSPY